MFLESWNHKEYDFLMNLQIPRLVMFITAQENDKKLAGIKNL